MVKGATKKVKSTKILDLSPVAESVPVSAVPARPSPFAETVLDTSAVSSEIKTFRDRLSKLVVGQQPAVEAVTQIYQQYLAGMHDSTRPVGNLLLLGPTGTGKTLLAEATAEVLHDAKNNLIIVDCAEFQLGHDVAKLIGSPPGYLGHRETLPALSKNAIQSVKSAQSKISVIVFDEIEKANDTLWNLLLGILDKGRLTLGDNTRVNFSETLIFLTSNLGARDIERFYRPQLGFSSGDTIRAIKKGKVDSKLSASISVAGNAAAKARFTPEFMNRLDAIVTFSPLSEENIRRILDLELEKFQNQVFVGKPFIIRVEDPVKSALVREGVSFEYGARYLKREISKRIIKPIASLTDSQQILSGDVVTVRALEDGEFEFVRTAAGLTATEMVRMAAEGETK